MPIKFKCPHCGKQLSVKDQLAGKRAKCPNTACGQPIVIPAAAPTPSAAPAPAMAGSQPAAAVMAAPPPPAVDPVAEKPPEADAEALAASLLADEAAPVDTAPPKTLRFNCSYCDEVVEVDVALAGKQAPCPECRRIIKIPHLQEQKKTDWRNANAALPSGARRDTEPAPEGAWGTVAATRVSGDALEEADALPEQREPVSVRRWIARGIVAAAVIGVLVFGTLLVLNRLAQSKQRAAYEQAMADVTGDKPTVSGYPAAVIHLAAGTYHLRRKEKDCVKADEGDDNAWRQFSLARGLLASDSGRRVPECDAMLIELALAQIDLAGNEKDVDERTRLKWDETSREISQTLRQVRDPLIRAQGMRLLARRLIDQGQVAVVIYLANQFPENPDVLATAFVELHLAGEKERAAPFAKNIIDMLNATPVPKQPPLVPTIEAQAVFILKGPRNKANALAGRMQPDDREVAEVTALLLADKFNEAHQRAIEKRLPDAARFRSLAVLADTPKTGAESKAAAEEALNLFTSIMMPRKEALQALVAYRLVDAGLRNGLDVERLRPVANAVQAEERLRPWVQLSLFRHWLEAQSGAADEKQLATIERNSLSQFLARVALARHNARKDSDTAKQIDDWDEAVRAFGRIGVAIGLQTNRNSFTDDPP